jgi:hypothetical protein
MSSLIIDQTFPCHFGSVARPAQRIAVQFLLLAPQTAVAAVESAKTVVETISNSSHPPFSDPAEDTYIEDIIEDDNDIEQHFSALDQAEKGRFSCRNI